MFFFLSIVNMDTLNWLPSYLRKADFFADPGPDFDSYIISMPEKEKMASSITSKLGLKSKGVRAVIGKKVEENLRELNLVGGKIRNAKEIGCLLSHYQVYKDFLQSKKETVLVLEDDCQIREDTEEYLHELMKIADKMVSREKPTIFYLGFCYPVFGKEIQKSGIHYLRSAICTQGYIINKHAAKILIENEVGDAIDRLMRRKKKEILMLGPKKAAINQDWTFWFDESKKKGQFKKELKRVENDENTTWEWVACIGGSLVLGLLTFVFSRDWIVSFLVLTFVLLISLLLANLIVVKREKKWTVFALISVLFLILITFRLFRIRGSLSEPRGNIRIAKNQAQRL